MLMGRESRNRSFSITKAGLVTIVAGIEVVVAPGAPGQTGYFPSEESTYQALIWPQSSLPQRPSGAEL